MSWVGKWARGRAKGKVVRSLRRRGLLGLVGLVAKGGVSAGEMKIRFLILLSVTS